MGLSLLIQAIKKLTQKQMGKAIVRNERDGKKISKVKNRKEGREFNKKLKDEFPSDRKSLHIGKKEAAESFRKTFKENKKGNK
jgi:hypothetical protein